MCTKERTLRVDCFASKQITDIGIGQIFLKYCKSECGWEMFEEFCEESLFNVLRSFKAFTTTKEFKEAYPTVTSSMVEKSINLVD